MQMAQQNCLQLLYEQDKNMFKLRSRFWLNITRKKFLIVRTLQQQNRLLQELVYCLFLQFFRWSLDSHVLEMLQQDSCTGQKLGLNYIQVLPIFSFYVSITCDFSRQVFQATSFVQLVCNCHQVKELVLLIQIFLLLAVYAQIIIL